MKYIMLPIHSEWVCLFLNGIKKIEVRSGTRLYNAINKLIEEQGKAPCLMYCTMGKPYLYQGKWFGSYFVENDKKAYGSDYLNGKVIAEFEASAEEIFSEGLENGCGGYNYSFYTEEINDIREKSCLDEFELREYLGEKRGGEVVGTAIHVPNLKPFDRPRELKDFGVRRSPQSWQFVEVDE